MRWKCDYGHLDELKNTPFRSSQHSELLTTFCDLRAASSDLILRVIIQLMLSSNPQQLWHCWNHQQLSLEGTPLCKHTLSTLLRDVFLVRNTILLSHLAFVGFSALPTWAGLVVGKLVDEQPLPDLAGSNDTSLDAQLFFKSLVEAVSAGSVAADSSGAHDDDVVS
jgi:hypothetical protein